MAIRIQERPFAGLGQIASGAVQGFAQRGQRQDLLQAAQGFGGNAQLARMLQGLPLPQAQALFGQLQLQQQQASLRAQQPLNTLQQSQRDLNLAKIQELQQPGQGATEIDRQAALGKLRDDRRALDAQNIAINAAKASGNLNPTEANRRIAVNNKRIQSLARAAQRINQQFAAQPGAGQVQQGGVGGFLANLFRDGQERVAPQGRVPSQQVGDLPPTRAVITPAQQAEQTKAENLLKFAGNPKINEKARRARWNKAPERIRALAGGVFPTQTIPASTDNTTAKFWKDRGFGDASPLLADDAARIAAGFKPRVSSETDMDKLRTELLRWQKIKISTQEPAFGLTFEGQEKTEALANKMISETVNRINQLQAQPATPTAAQPQAIPTINNQAEWDNLPSGTTFKDGDGNTWRKP